MSEFINNFEIFSKISEDLSKVIQFFHVFDDQNGYTVLFVTSDDNVYGFGQNSYGSCGLGHNYYVSDPQLINELCNKNITQFFFGYNFVLALNTIGKVFGWGVNNVGQLGTGNFNDEKQFLRPEMIFFPDDEIICQISCGAFHSLALTTYGTVYSWGYNGFGQIGCGLVREDNCVSPYELTQLENYVIKQISCSIHRSYALTHDGQVFCWGDNNWCALGLDLERDEKVFEPKLISISNVQSVCPSARNTYFLSNDGFIYFCGKCEDNSNESIQIIPKPLASETNFEALNSIPDYHKKGQHLVTAFSCGTVHDIHNNTIDRTEFKSFCEFYSKKHKISFNTISVITGNSVQYIEQQNNIIEQNIRESSLNFFIKKKDLGEGAFGKVAKYECRIDQKMYAIKKVEGINSNEKFMREVEAMIRIAGDFVVQYYNSWIKNNVLFIQMELCSDNLRNCIETKRKLKISKVLSESVDYFISSQLFKELLECVQYLHGLSSPIIHRDLKPENILIADSPRNGRFLKLCDFGLAVNDGMFTLSHTQSEGTKAYMAPEVMLGSGGRAKYSFKADIYSLAIIGEDLFDTESYEEEFENCSKKFQLLVNVIKRMSVRHYKDRPTCIEVLENVNDWVINTNELAELTQIIEKLRKQKNQFFSKYVESKCI